MYGFLTMGGWFPVSISFFIMGVVPICLSSVANTSSFALSTFSKSRLVCLSVGVSFNSGLLCSTKSSCRPISLILVTGDKSYSLMRVLTSIKPVFLFLEGMWCNCFFTGLHSDLTSFPFLKVCSNGTFFTFATYLVLNYS